MQGNESIDDVAVWIPLPMLINPLLMESTLRYSRDIFAHGRALMEKRWSKPNVRPRAAATARGSWGRLDEGEGAPPPLRLVWKSCTVRFTPD